MRIVQLAAISAILAFVSLPLLSEGPASANAPAVELRPSVADVSSAPVAKVSVRVVYEGVVIR